MTRKSTGLSRAAAEAIVLRAAARTIVNDIDLGAGWIVGDDGNRPEADQAAIRGAVQALADRWERRAKRLAPEEA
jgi:hypothetical protein